MGLVTTNGLDDSDVSRLKPHESSDSELRECCRVRVDNSTYTTLAMRLGVTSGPTARKSDYNICGGGTWVKGGWGEDRLRLDRRATARYSSVHLLPAKYENTYIYSDTSANEWPC